MSSGRRASRVAARRRDSERRRHRGSGIEVSDARSGDGDSRCLRSARPRPAWGDPLQDRPHVGLGILVPVELAERSQPRRHLPAHPTPAAQFFADRTHDKNVRRTEGRLHAAATSHTSGRVRSLPRAVPPSGLIHRLRTCEERSVGCLHPKSILEAPWSKGRRWNFLRDTPPLDCEETMLTATRSSFGLAWRCRRPTSGSSGGRPVSSPPARWRRSCRPALPGRRRWRFGWRGQAGRRSRVKVRDVEGGPVGPCRQHPSVDVVLAGGSRTPRSD